MLTGVLGFPVGHSRSPAMMAAAFAELGVGWRYLRLPVPPQRFVEVVRALPRSGYVGVNVTIPHKLAAAQVADERSPAVESVGAANTLTFADGRMEADNTDGLGFLDALGGSPRGARALVLGAGGAGRALVWALRQAGAAEVMVWNRTPERARKLAREMGAREVRRPEPADLIVNATSVGLDPKLSQQEALAALSLEQLDPPELVCDLVYGDGPTPLVRWARAAGARVVDGIEVLACQGARSLERWTGRPPPLEIMLEAARSPATS